MFIFLFFSSFSLLCPQGYKQQKAFIITQGPMDTTIRDFWKMVYNRKCGAIVMLSKLSEVSYCDPQGHRQGHRDTEIQRHRDTRAHRD